MWLNFLSVPGLDREEIRQWYNGYNWLGTSVYNPFDLLLFRNRDFRAYWFETGTPTFLIKLLAARQQFRPSAASFAALGLDIRLEDSTNHGRIDMAVRFNGQVFLFEFKVVELTPQGRALQQIKDQRYADKYLGRGEPVHLIGVEFSKASRNVVGFEVLTLHGM